MVVLVHISRIIHPLFGEVHPTARPASFILSNVLYWILKSWTATSMCPESSLKLLHLRSIITLSWLPGMYNHIWSYAKWFFVTFSYPIWRSLNLWKGHLNIQKGMYKNSCYSVLSNNSPTLLSPQEAQPTLTSWFVTSQNAVRGWRVFWLLGNLHRFFLIKRNPPRNWRNWVPSRGSTDFFKKMLKGFGLKSFPQHIPRESFGNSSRWMIIRSHVYPFYTFICASW